MATGLSRRERLFAGAVPLVLAVAVLAPLLLHRGYTLRGDMVFVPDQPWKAAWLGLDGGVPRAVPGDALTWLAGTVVAGDLVQKAVLFLILLLAGVGTARLVHALVGSDGSAGRGWLLTAPSVALFVWNPYVYERLSIGHWALLCGYAALPWVVLVARGQRPLLVVVPVAVAAWTSPTGGVLASVTAIAVLAVALPRRQALVGSALVALVNLPWAVPGLLAPQGTGDETRTAAAAFAARADTPWGDLGSLLSFGGLWKDSVDPPGRDEWLLGGAGLLLTLVGLVGLVALARRSGSGARRVPVVLGGLALVGLLLAWLPTAGPGQDLMAGLGALPGGGLLRDSQKWVALLALAAAVGLGEAVHRWLPRGGHGTFWAVALAVLPVAAMPGLAWGLAGTLDTVAYPRDWAQVREVMDQAGAQDARTVVLPFDVYRRFPWNDGTAVLDPAPRYFPGDVVVDDALPVRGAVVPGENPVAARLREAAGSPRLTEVLAEEGIRFVLVEHSTPGADRVVVPPGDVLYDGAELTLVDLGHGGEPRHLGAAGTSAVVAGDLAAIGAVLTPVVLAWRARRRPSPGRGADWHG